jgi:hypothetical protein
LASTLAPRKHVPHRPARNQKKRAAGQAAKEARHPNMVPTFLASAQGTMHTMNMP